MLNKTAQDIANEFVRTDIGKPLLYYTGYLMQDVERYEGRQLVIDQAVARLRDFAWNLYEEGRVHLTQKKISNAEYEFRTVTNDKNVDEVKQFLVKEAVYEYYMTKRLRMRP